MPRPLRWTLLSDSVLEVFTGSVSQFAEFLIRATVTKTLLFVDRSSGAELNYILGETELQQLIQARSDPARLRAELASYQPVASIEQYEVPQQPSVVVENGAIKGVWVPVEPTPIVTYELDFGGDLVDGGEALYGSLGSRRRRTVRVPAVPRPTSGPAPAPGATDRPDATELADAIDRRDDTAGRGEPTIRRTPHLDAPDLISTHPASRFIVAVRTDRRKLRESEEGTDVVIDAPESVTEVELDVWLSTSEHFTIVPTENEPELKESKKLKVRRADSDSESVEFALEVRAEAPNYPAGIVAVFSYRGRTCGHVNRSWDWDNSQPQAAAAKPRRGTARSLAVQVDAQPPDLSVFITQPTGSGGPFSCAIQTNLIDGFDVPTVSDYGLTPLAPELAKEMLADVVRRGATPAQRRSALEVAGYDLWEAAPPAFQSIIWELVDRGRRPRNIYIASAETTLPWELMIPTRRVNGQPEELRPLGVEFAVGRWTRGDLASPQQNIPVRDALVIAPRYAGARALPLSEAEAEYITDNLNGQRIDPAKIDSLDAYLQQTHASLVHFVGHGGAGARDESIYLDGDEELRSRMMRTLKGFKALGKQRAPFIFLNCCDAARLSPSLAGGAGFPRAFGDLGARAIIAPLWAVADRIAHEVATELYAEALKPNAAPVAEILRGIRERAYSDEGADTYAAYAFFGDPLARLEILTTD